MKDKPTNTLTPTVQKAVEKFDKQLGNIIPSIEASWMRTFLIDTIQKVEKDTAMEIYTDWEEAILYSENEDGSLSQLVMLNHLKNSKLRSQKKV